MKLNRKHRDILSVLRESGPLTAAQIVDHYPRRFRVPNARQVAKLCGQLPDIIHIEKIRLDNMTYNQYSLISEEY